MVKIFCNERFSAEIYMKIFWRIIDHKMLISVELEEVLEVSEAALDIDMQHDIPERQENVGAQGYHLPEGMYSS